MLESGLLVVTLSQIIVSKFSVLSFLKSENFVLLEYVQFLKIKTKRVKSINSKYWSAILLVASVCVEAQTNPSNSFEQWKKQSSEQFQQYVSEQDKAFSGFLKQKWVKASVATDEAKNQQPKIPTAPVAAKKRVAQPKVQSTPVKINPVKLSKKKLPSVVPVVPNNKSNSSELYFLGHKLLLPNLEIKSLIASRPDANLIANAWLAMAQTNSDQLVSTLRQTTNKLNLDDWGKAILTYQFIQHQHKLAGNSYDNRSQLALYTWYYLVKQGMNVRIAYDDTQIYLLLNSNMPLYAQKYFSFGGDKYYFVDFSGNDIPSLNKVYTYQKQHASGTSPLQIDLSKMPTLTHSDVTRTLSFSYNEQEFEIDVNYHKDYIKFLDQYPQLEVKHYFSTQLSEQTKQSVLQPLAKIIEGRSEQEALNILLRFVQKGLAYQTDDQQFNKENFMFATEALHYPYADCEDRSVLFSYLVTNLLSNKIIGVLYKGHIATAIKLETPINGASYDVNGDKFYIADPTYIGADLGDVMPGYERQSPRLITVN